MLSPEMNPFVNIFLRIAQAENKCKQDWVVKKVKARDGLSTPRLTKRKSTVSVPPHSTCSLHGRPALVLPVLNLYFLDDHILIVV